MRDNPPIALIGEVGDGGKGSVDRRWDRVTGFVADGMTEAVASPPAAQRLDRATIRRRFEARFRVERVARDDLALSGEVSSRGVPGRRRTAAATGAN